MKYIYIAFLGFLIGLIYSLLKFFITCKKKKKVKKYMFETEKEFLDFVKSIYEDNKK